MVKIVGHRGATGYAPENTSLSFQTAIDIGCDRTELDVQLSKDGEVVVIHDEEVSRVTDGEGLVSEKTLEELKKLNCAQGQKILTLQEVIDFCKEKIDLQIELKAEGTPRKVNELIVKNHIQKNVVITSFNVELLREIKSLNTQLEVGLLFKEYSENIWELVKNIPLDFIGPKGEITTQEIVDEAHELGITVYAFHVKDEVLGERLMAMGVDEIGTDFPKLFINS